MSKTTTQKEPGLSRVSDPKTASELLSRLLAGFQEIDNGTNLDIINSDTKRMDSVARAVSRVQVHFDKTGVMSKEVRAFLEG